MKAHIPDEPLIGCKAQSLKADDSPSKIVFFDLDNTLYPKSLGVHNQMAERIQLFFQTHLNIPAEESRRLGARFYLDYGLAIRGIMKHFEIDPEVYNDFVDGGLGLEAVMHTDDRLIDIFQRLRDRGVRLWVFTNAGLKHAQRVMSLLGVAGFFEGIVYCDYAEPGFPAKPDRLAYERAMRCAGITRNDCCYFVDDAPNNVRVAMELGWHAVHLHEAEQDSPAFSMSTLSTLDPPFPQISSIYDIEMVFPELFVDEAESVESEPIQNIASNSKLEQEKVKLV